jgi:small subunit ribosomal protein S19e
MAKVYDVSSQKLIAKTAEVLEKEGFRMPAWARNVKTASGAERAPVQKNWWFLRLASILRKVYVKGPIGVEKLRREYGKPKRGGVAPKHKRKAAGKIIRVCLQELEKKGYIKKAAKGRIITAQGQKFLDSLSKEVK